MRSIMKSLLFAALAVPGLAQAQGTDTNGPPHALISIYHIAPGKHLEFLKWMAAREAIDKEAGIAATQLYAHVDGDSWDYLSVSPDTTPEQDKKVDAMLKQHGLSTGFKASLEIRQFFASHTDTFAVGPTTAAALVAEATK